MAGVFIIWDRLFGSFQEELDDDPVVFGIRGAVSSWNPLWVNAQVYAQLLRDCWHTSNWWHKATLWFRRTGWRPPDVEARFPLVKTELSDFKKFDPALTEKMKRYAIVQYIINSAIGLILLVNFEHISVGQQLLGILFVVLSSLSLGLYLEGRLEFIYLEYVKHVILLTLGLYFWEQSSWSVAGVLFPILSFGLLAQPKSKEYLNQAE